VKLLFVINPVSGGTDKSDQIEQIKVFCAENGHEADLLLLNGESDNALIRKHVGSGQPDCLVAMGGDGTVKLVAEEAMKAGRPMSILPAGSANGMARELGLPDDFSQALSVIVNGVEQAIDVLRVNNEICLHLSDIGLNAQLIKYYKQNNLRGMIGYARGVARVLVRQRTLHVHIRTHDTLLRREAVMVALANARMYGTGAMINPDGDLTDGWFEVVVMRRLSALEILKMFWRFRPYDPTKTEVIRAQGLHIETRRKAYLQIDGEYQGLTRDIRAWILPGALRVRLPVALSQ
jgi:diacylglycerol kinase (ATP)